MTTHLVTRLHESADLADNETAHEEAQLIREAVAEIERLEREKASGAFHPWKAALEATVERLSEELDDARAHNKKMRDALTWLASPAAGMPDDIVSYANNAIATDEHGGNAT